MTKKPLIVGNWKMELSHKAALELVRALKKLLRGVDVTGEVIVCPSYVSLQGAADMLKRSESISVGAQNVHWEEKGAWTGEVSAVQLKSFARWCIVGHSERRALTGETDEQVLQKANVLLKHGIVPIICIGETAQERDSDTTVRKITRQMDTLLSHSERFSLTRLVIAYEPIWAIGTGVLPDPDEVAEVLLLVRKLVAAQFDEDIAERLCVMYGGSVRAENVSQYIAGPGADGVLVGGASVRPKEFVEIVKKVQEAWE